MTGVFHSFPKKMKSVQESGPHVSLFVTLSLSPSEQTGKYDLVFKLYERIQNEPKIAEYMKSNRRQQFSHYGVFRYYPELDDDE
jgi:hypothetical protein